MLQDGKNCMFITNLCNEDLPDELWYCLGSML